MFGLIYKLACIGASLVGLVAAFPMASYLSVVSYHYLNNGGLVILAVIAATTAVVAWGVLSASRNLKSTAPSSFIAPTIAAVIGIVLALVGVPFAQGAPGYY